MPPALRLLILEDDPFDTELVVATLEEAGFECQWDRIETRAEFLACLQAPTYDLILADYNLPTFDGLQALSLLLENDLDLPLILVSGTLGEERAIESLKAGATDYVLKNRLSRLVPVVQRALREAEDRRKRKRAEEEMLRSSHELARALERLRELDRLKSEFMQNVSHELRTPLCLALGYAELLNTGELGTLQADQQHAVAKITDRLRMLSELVDRINSLLAVESQVLPREPLDFAELVVPALDDFQLVFEQHQVSLSSDLQSGVPPVLGSPFHIRQALDNLLSNACKFTPTGGSVHVTLLREAEHAVLEISDTGVGIPADQQERIFDRFYQVDGSITRDYEGIGLGLALVKEIVSALDGTVSVSSAPGRGATFRLSLPLVQEG